MIDRQPAQALQTKSRLLAITAVLTIAVAGCTTMEQASADIDAALKVCASRKFDTFVQSARCRNDAEARMHEIIGADLAGYRRAVRMSLAERLDRKKITEAEAMVEFSTANMEITSRALARLNAQYDRESRALTRPTPASASSPVDDRPIVCMTKPQPLGEVRTECERSGIRFSRGAPF